MSKRVLTPKAINPGLEFLAQRRRQCAVVIAALLSVATLIGLVQAYRTLRSPDTALLVSSNGARWIIEDRPVDVNGRPVKEQTTWFRRTFDVAASPAQALLHLRGFRRCSAALDGQTVLAEQLDPSMWRESREIDLAPLLKTGEHTLVIKVMNDRGPPAAIAYCAELRLVTDEQWQASIDQAAWHPARFADQPRQPPLSAQYPSVPSALLRTLPVWLTVAAIVTGIVLLFRAESSFGQRLGRLAQASTVRWVLMAMWAALSLNNLWRLPSYIAFDAVSHMQYIEYVAINWRIPLASEGWQMFQSPLYYMISAPLYALAGGSAGLDAKAMIVRLVPIVCGLGMIEVLRRVMRRVFPARNDLQSLGILLGAMLPMNVYICQMVGNEPVAGVTSALVILLALGLTGDVARSERIGPFVIIGAALGLALLAKATAIVLAPIIAVWVAACLWSHGASARRMFRGLVLFVVSALVVSGWYYARNLIEFKGHLFVGGWDPIRKIEWWQDPGFRTPMDLVRFDRALTQPIFAAFNGFRDALYSTMWTDGYLSGRTEWETRPPWNDHFLIAGAPLGLIPSALLLVGLAVLIRKPLKRGRSPLLLSGVCVLAYLAAMWLLFVQLPIYSTVKASYLMGITPCLAIISMCGAQQLMKNRIARAVVVGLMCGWAVNVWLTYFVVRAI